MNRTKKTVLLGVATAFCLVLSYIEAILPPIYAAVPGIKMGLPNVLILFLLYRFSIKEAAAVSLVRLLLSSLLFGNTVTLLYSFAGAVLSLAVMALLKISDRFSPVGVSIAGGVMHNLGQIIVAMLIMQTKEIGYYMIVLAVSGTLAGVIVGLAGALLLKYAEKLKI